MAMCREAVTSLFINRQIHKSIRDVTDVNCEISGDVYWRIERMRNDKSEAPRCLPNNNGSFNVLHVYWSNKGH